MGFSLFVLVPSLLGAAFFAGMRMFTALRGYVVRKRHNPCGEGHATAGEEFIEKSMPTFDTSVPEAPNSSSQTRKKDIPSDTLLKENDVEDILTMQNHFCLPLPSATRSETAKASQTTAAFPESVHLENGSLQNRLIRDDMPFLPSLMYPSVISTRVYPSEVASDCFAILLKEVRRGSCTKRGFESFFKLMQKTEKEDHATLERLLGSAIVFLLISRVTDETFKTSGLYEVAFGVLVRLLDNKDVFNLTTQPEFLEVIDWILREGTLESKNRAAVFLLKLSGADPFYHG